MLNEPMQVKFGRKPPKNAPSLLLADFLSGIIPDHPLSEDYLKKLQNWQMLGNDRYGDCVAVTWANMRRLVTGVLALARTMPAWEAGLLTTALLWLGAALAAGRIRRGRRRA